MLFQQTLVDTYFQPVIQIVEQVKHEPEKPKEPTKHIVQKGETLTTISKAYNVPVERLFYKNLHITHPDAINAGDELVVPENDEVLSERVYAIPAKNTSVSRPKSGYSVSGNLYQAGQCTHYAKQRRPDLPNNLGNARTWVSRAAAQGILTGSEPRAGAIGQKGNHVVYVEQIHGDGTMTITDQNYRRAFEITTRTVSTSGWMFIY